MALARCMPNLPTKVRNELLKEAGCTCIELMPFLSLISQCSNYLWELAHEKTDTRIFPVKSHASESERYENAVARLELGERYITLLTILYKLEDAENNLKSLVEVQPD